MYFRGELIQKHRESLCLLRCESVHEFLSVTDSETVKQCCLVLKRILSVDQKWVYPTHLFGARAIRKEAAKYLDGCCNTQEEVVEQIGDSSLQNPCRLI